MIDPSHESGEFGDVRPENTYEGPFVSEPLSPEESPDEAEAPRDLAILFVSRQESLSDVLKRLEEPLELIRKGGSLLIVFPKGWVRSSSTRARQEFFSLIGPHTAGIFIAGHDRVLLLSAKDKNITVFSEKGILRTFLRHHPHAAKAIRHFSSERWQEALFHFFTRLRTLSVHRVSVTVFLVASILLFFSVLFVAIPSARIRIWPTVNLVSHTANIVLVASGAVIEADQRHTLPLIPIRATVERELVFTEISKKFLGENAETEMTILNESDELYSLRSGTRLVNQAGMIFRIQAPVQVPPATLLEPGMVRVPAIAATHDLYGQIIGERGNVPAGIKWEIPGIPVEERKFVFARNVGEAKGGVTRYGQELQEKDLELARKQLEQELLSVAKENAELEVLSLSGAEGTEYVVFQGKQYDVLNTTTLSGFVVPTHLIGQEIGSFPIKGTLQYQVLAYNKDALLSLLLPDLLKHVEEGHELVERSAVSEGISVHVIEYDDAHQWVKITAELTGKQRSVLNPVSRSGRAFTEKVREMIRGKSIPDAERILQNFPEVERVQISVWPPWRGSIPSLMSNITILPQGQ